MSSIYIRDGDLCRDVPSDCTLPSSRPRKLARNLLQRPPQARAGQEAAQTARQTRRRLVLTATSALTQSSANPQKSLNMLPTSHGQRKRWVRWYPCLWRTIHAKCLQINDSDVLMSSKISKYDPPSQLLSDFSPPSSATACCNRRPNYQLGLQRSATYQGPTHARGPTRSGTNYRSAKQSHSRSVTYKQKIQLALEIPNIFIHKQKHARQHGWRYQGAREPPKSPSHRDTSQSLVG